MNGFAKQWSFFSAALLSFSLISTIFPVQAQLSPEVLATSIAQSSEKPNLQAIQKQAEQLVEWIGTKQYDKVIAALPPDLKSVWSAEKLQQVWENDVIADTGAYKRIVESRVVDAVNADLVFVTTEFANTTEDIILTYSDDGQMIGANFPKTKSIEEIAEAFIKALSDKDYAIARGYLHPLLKAEILPQRVQEGWENLIKENGNFERTVGIENRDSGEQDVLFMTVRFAKRQSLVVLVFDANKQIVNVDYSEAD